MDTTNHKSPQSPSVLARLQALDRIQKCVTTGQSTEYGDAEVNFAETAALLNVALGRKLKESLVSADVAIIQACCKIARLINNPTHLDSWVDLGGYAVCGAGIVSRQAKCRKCGSPLLWKRVVGVHCSNPQCASDSQCTGIAVGRSTPIQPPVDSDEERQAAMRDLLGQKFKKASGDRVAEMVKKAQTSLDKSVVHELMSDSFDGDRV